MVNVCSAPFENILPECVTSAYCCVSTASSVGLWDSVSVKLPLTCEDIKKVVFQEKREKETKIEDHITVI